VRILSVGKIPPPVEYEETCEKCGTVFAFTRKDIMSNLPCTVRCPLCGVGVYVSLDHKIKPEEETK